MSIVCRSNCHLAKLVSAVVYNMSAVLNDIVFSIYCSCSSLSKVLLTRHFQLQGTNVFQFNCITQILLLVQLAQTIDVPCNFTAPCLQWLSSRCVTQVQCLRIECSEIPLKNRNLVHFGRREFFHGYTMSVSCQAGYSFKEVDTQQQRIACLNGEWIPLPECRKRRTCLINIPHNGAAFSSNQRFLPPFNVLQDGQTVK